MANGDTPKKGTIPTTVVVLDEEGNVISVVNPFSVTVIESALPSGAAISAKQQSPSTVPTVYNVELTDADTQYSQALPSNTKEIRFRCRTLFDVRFAWITGKVATPTAPYLILPAGSDYSSDDSNITGKTLYLASNEAGVVVEIEVWK